MRTGGLIIVAVDSAIIIEEVESEDGGVDKREGVSKTGRGGQIVEMEYMLPLKCK